MTLPWVSRETYARAVTEAATWRAEYGEMRTAYDALLEKYHALKVQGAAVPEPLAAPERKGIDPAVQAINARCVGRPGLRDLMLRQLAADRRSDVPEDEILAQIEGGVTPDDGVPV